LAQALWKEALLPLAFRVTMRFGHSTYRIASGMPGVSGHMRGGRRVAGCAGTETGRAMIGGAGCRVGCNRRGASVGARDLSTGP